MSILFDNENEESLFYECAELKGKISALLEALEAVESVDDAEKGQYCPWCDATLEGFWNTAHGGFLDEKIVHEPDCLRQVAIVKARKEVQG